MNRVDVVPKKSIDAICCACLDFVCDDVVYCSSSVAPSLHPSDPAMAADAFSVFRQMVDAGCHIY